MTAVYEEVKKQHGQNTFQLLKNSHQVLCSFCLDKFQIFPQRGNLTNNIKQHIKSTSHQKAAKKKPQGTLQSFLQQI
jgi:hypothetical protein